MVFLLKEINTENEVFMPHRLIFDEVKVNSEVSAFVYVDTNEKNLVATTEIPYAEVGEYAYLRCVQALDFGAFVDWGLEKDLLVPGNEQKEKFQPNQYYIVRICLEEGVNRIYGTTKLGKHLENTIFDVDETDRVQIVPVEKTNLGYRCIVNKKYIGMIYHNEIFKNIETEREYSGVVKKIREDGLLDLAMQVQGIQNLFEAKDKIMAILQKHEGRIETTDKSSPEEIRRVFGMSKKTFKNALGMLYKERKVLITKTEISLNSN